MSQKVKILSGWSHQGGSTVAFIRLCNALNKAGYDCTFYGPHKWHVSKCKGALIERFAPEKDDIILYHFLPAPKERGGVKKLYLVTHEKSGYNVQANQEVFDKVIFLHEEHREWHKVSKERSIIIPNFFEDFNRAEPPKGRNVAGVIGSIEPRKNTVVSIKRALEANHDEVYLYGGVLSENYFNQEVKPLLDKHKNVIHKGYADSKQLMYDSIDHVYHFAKEEIACFVLGECKLQNIPCTYGEGTYDYEMFSNEEVLAKWKEVLK